jgi:glutamate racemase
VVAIIAEIHGDVALSSCLFVITACNCAFITFLGTFTKQFDVPVFLEVERSM